MFLGAWTGQGQGGVMAVSEAGTGAGAGGRDGSERGWDGGRGGGRGGNRCRARDEGERRTDLEALLTIPLLPAPPSGPRLLLLGNPGGAAATSSCEAFMARPSGSLSRTALMRETDKGRGRRRAGNKLYESSNIPNCALGCH